MPSVVQFDEEHERRNGFRRDGTPVEVVALRASARLPAPVDIGRLGARPVPGAAERRAADGPRVLAESDCTVWVPEGWRAEVGGGGSWILRRCKS